MNLVGIIALSLLAGAFLIVIVGGLATLIVLHLRVQKSHAELVSAMAEFTANQSSSIGQNHENLENLMEDAAAEFGDLVGQCKVDLVAIIESARSSFGSIRQEIKTSLAVQDELFDASLKAHASLISEKVGSINGQMLEQASIRAVRALGELTQLTTTLRNLLHSHETQPGADLAPEEYGPSDDLFVKQGDTARMDAMAERYESSSMYDSQFAEGLPVVRTEF